MDNFPPGVRYDKSAPCNEPIEPEVDVTVRTTLVKETVVIGCTMHTFVEYETDPDTGRQVGITITEPGDDVEEMFHYQHMTPLEIINACRKLAKLLIAEKHYNVEGIWLSSLVDDCDGWEETELNIEH